MPSTTPTRAELWAGSAVAGTLTSIAVLLGALLGRAGGAVISALGAGCCTAIGFFLNGRPSIASCVEVRQAAHDRGYAAGLSQALLHGLVQYEAAIFPASPDGVTTEEQAARRIRAYRVAAEDAVPENIRRLAADVLAALDMSDHERARDAIQALALTTQRLGPRP
ncbi:hypothetical protein [Streptomyces sp. MBT27]|uniref:hypothetical protein n=1 Tax=Streptomyces sp. MBT27 TaxID=1488356 RepID=UPI00141F141B|nr:hypothetical protein [Streptomyces sp. MBT27]